MGVCFWMACGIAAVGLALAIWPERFPWLTK